MCPTNPLPPTHIKSHLSVRTHRTLETLEPNLFSLILSPVASNLSNAVSHPYLLTQPHTQPTHIYPPRQLVFTHYDHSRPNHTQNFHPVADWAPSRLPFLPIPVNIQLCSFIVYYQSFFHRGYHSRSIRTITGDHRTPVSTPLFDFLLLSKLKHAYVGFPRVHKSSHDTSPKPSPSTRSVPISFRDVLGTSP